MAWRTMMSLAGSLPRGALAAALAASTLAACGGAEGAPDNGDCSCVVVDEGADVVLACGDTHCIGEAGLLCADHDTVEDTTCEAEPPPPPPPPPPARYRGDLELLVQPPYWVGNGQSGSTMVSGGFVKSDHCQRQQVGTCQVERCTYPIADSYDAPGRFHVSPAFTGQFAWDPGPFRMFFRVDGVPWDPGDQVTMAWDGETVPAGQAVLRNPSAGRWGDFDNLPPAVSHARSADLALTWDPIASPTLIRIRQDRDVGFTGHTILDCEFPAGSRGGTIPSVALRELRSSNEVSYDDVDIDVFGVTRAEVRAGDYGVHARILRGFDWPTLRYRMP